MEFGKVAERGLVLLGCGKMGSAMLAGWLNSGVAAKRIWVVEPSPSEWLGRCEGLHLNEPLPDDPAVLLIAVKPQMMDDALAAVERFGGGRTVILSIAAGTPISTFESAFGERTPIIRAMPNTPAAIGKGITAIVGNKEAAEPHLALAETLLAAIGKTVRLEDEEDIDAVTGLSGSGPAYVFYLIETLAEAGVAQGLSTDLAMQLATSTVAGAGALAEASDQDPAELRRNVTSPNGTTQAGLEVLMRQTDGLRQLVDETVAAATARSVELRG